MHAIQLLKSDHETAKRAFGQIQVARAEQRAALWAKLRPELKVHEEIEEAALYGPVADEIGSRDETLKEWREHHHEEVGELEAIVQRHLASIGTMSAP